LSFKKGDLNLIHSKAWYCKKKGDMTNRILVLKQLDCLDDSIYNMKIHEANLMLNFRHHPNLSNLLSVWKVEPRNSISYRIIYMVFEHASAGNFQEVIMNNHKRFPRKMAFKYLGDIAKGLYFLHHNDCVHGGIRMKNLLVNRKNDGVLGPTKKCELESMRKTRQLLSQFSTERNIKDYFIYWAPELLMDQGVTKASDIWSFGVVIFIICTGQLPFSVNKRDSIFNTIVSGMIKWDLLDNWGSIKTLVQGMLAMDSKKRIDSTKVFDFFQREAAKVISRFVSVSVKKVKLVRESKAAIKIQSFFRMLIANRRLIKMRVDRCNNAVIKIQKAYRNFKNAKDYRERRKRLMKVQAKVLSRQIRRAYLKFKKDVVNTQA
jgi:serine/threonine protein kinase